MICLTNADYISVTPITGRHMHDSKIDQATQAFRNWSSHTGWITPQRPPQRHAHHNVYVKVRKTQEGGLNCVSFFFFLKLSPVYRV